MKKSLLALTVLASVVSIQAQAYQTEVGGFLGYVDPDTGSGAANYGVDGTFYFKPVTVGNAPLNEAAFLSRASNINATAGYADNDNTSRTELGAGIEYFVPNSNFYTHVGVEYNREKVELSGASNLTDRDTTITGEIGYLPLPGLLVSAGVAHVKTETETALASTDSSDTSPLLRAKYVTKVGGYNMNFEGRGIFGNDTKKYNLGTDFYLDQTLSIGATYENIDGKGTNDNDKFGINAKKFFNQQISLEGNVDFEDEQNVYGVRVGYRF